MASVAAWLLVLAALLLFPSDAKGLTMNLSADANEYRLGSTVILTGTIDMSQHEYSELTSLDLTIAGPQGCTATLPVIEVTDEAIDCNETGGGKVYVTTAFQNVSYVLPNETRGTGYNWLRPATGYGYNPVSYGYGYGNAQVVYTIKWASPVWLSPQPIFSLLPSMKKVYDIPALDAPATPTPGGPQALDDNFGATEMFDLPTIEPPPPPANMPSVAPNATFFADIPMPVMPDNPAGAPSNLPAADVLFSVPGYEVGAPPTGADPVLPVATEVFSIPEYVEVRPSSAPADVGDAAGGVKVFDVPTWTETKPDSAAADMPVATEAFSVPAWSLALPAGAPDGLPAATVVFDVPEWEEPIPSGAPARLADGVTPTVLFAVPQVVGGTKNVTGLVKVPGGNIWMVVEGSPSDVLAEVNSTTGALVQLSLIHI